MELCWRYLGSNVAGSVGPSWVLRVCSHVGSCRCHFFQKVFSPSTMTVFDRPMLDASRGPFEPFWGHVEELTLETLSSVASEVASLCITVPAKHFFSETLLLPGTGIAKMPPERVYVGPSWGYVGPFGVYVGAMFDLGAMLGLCCHILACC